jgi:hypothetical protein
MEHWANPLQQLDRGLEYLEQHNPEFDEGYLRRPSYIFDS